MSDYHILQTSNNASRATVYYHIAVPDENNSVGVNLRTALVYYLGDSAASSSVPNLENDFATEFANLGNGSVYEHGENHKFGNPTATLIQKRQELDSRYNNFATTIVNDLRSTLKFYRLDRDVP